MIAQNNFTVDSSSEKWFDEVLATLSTHKLMLEQNLANKDWVDFYNTLIGGNMESIMLQGKESSQRYFIPK